MKTIKILLGCVIALLVVGIYILLDTRKTDNSKQDIKMSSIDCAGKEYSKNYPDGQYSNGLHYNDENELDIPMAVYDESNTENERMAMCKVCSGLGYEPFSRMSQRCPACNGNKQLPESEVETAYEEWGREEIDCPICGGTGWSYERRIMSPDEVIMNVPRGYYDCKVCNGKKKGTRAELKNNFDVAKQVYGAAL